MLFVVGVWCSLGMAAVLIVSTSRHQAHSYKSPLDSRQSVDVCRRGETWFVYASPCQQPKSQECILIRRPCHQGTDGTFWIGGRPILPCPPACLILPWHTHRTCRTCNDGQGKQIKDGLKKTVSAGNIVSWKHDPLAKCLVEGLPICKKCHDAFVREATARARSSSSGSSQGG